MFERETHREKILEARNREIKLRKQKAQGTVSLPMNICNKNHIKIKYIVHPNRRRQKHE